MQSLQAGNNKSHGTCSRGIGLKRGYDILFLCLVVITAVIVFVGYFGGEVTKAPILGVGTRESRVVDTEKVLKMIQEGKLSDKEALYYQKLEER